MFNKKFITKPRKKCSVKENQYIKMGNISLSLLSAILIIGLISGEAQAKGKDYIYECVTRTGVNVCVKRDELKRCIKVKWKMKCSEWRKVRKASGLMSPKIMSPKINKFRKK